MRRISSLDGDDARAVGDAEYMLYQTLLGAWPLEGPDATLRRAHPGLRAESRARRQGGDELAQSASALRGRPQDLHRAHSRSLPISGEFLESLAALARRVALLGALNSLSQLTLKATLPGVPDFYQGTEFWDLSLVDPDNRRPVDFAARADALAALHTPDWDDACAELAGRASQARLDRASPEVADRACGGLHGWRLSAAGGQRAASRPRRRLCAAARQERRDRRGRRDGSRRSRKAAASGRKADAFDATINVRGFAVEGDADAGTEIRVSSLFQQLPVAVLKASVVSAARPARKKAVA